MILNQLESQFSHQFELKTHYTLHCTPYFDAFKPLNVALHEKLIQLAL